MRSFLAFVAALAILPFAVIGAVYSVWLVALLTGLLRGDRALPVADLVSAVRSLSIADPRGLSAVVLLLRSSARFLRQGGRPAGRGACSNRGVAASCSRCLPTPVLTLASGWRACALIAIQDGLTQYYCVYWQTVWAAFAGFAGGRTVGSLVLQLYD